MPELLVQFIAGAVIGWWVSPARRTRSGLWLNIAVGALSASLAGLVLAPWLGISPNHPDNVSLPGLIVALAGAVAALVLVKLFRPGWLPR